MQVLPVYFKEYSIKIYNNEDKIFKHISKPSAHLPKFFSKIYHCRNCEVPVLHASRQPINLSPRIAEDDSLSNAEGVV